MKSQFATRESLKRLWLPPNLQVYHQSDLAEVCFYNTKQGGKPAAIAWKGRADNPTFHYTFLSDARRRDYAENFLADLLAHKANVAARRKGTPAADFFKVGDILDYSWGYDQTNAEFYQVLEVKAKSIIIREIASRPVPNSQGFMCQHVIPVRDAFLKSERPMVKMVKSYPDSSNKAYVSMEYGSASLWDGTPNYSSWYA